MTLTDFVYFTQYVLAAVSTIIVVLMIAIRIMNKPWGLDDAGFRWFSLVCAVANVAGGVWIWTLNAPSEVTSVVHGIATGLGIWAIRNSLLILPLI